MSDPFALNILYFVLGALVIGFGGSNLAMLADQLADRTGMGEAITGTVVLGLMTALPGIGATVSTAASGLASMTASNALGGIAIQTVFLAIADMAYRRANLEHAAASMPNMVQTGILVLLLIIISLGFLGPNIHYMGINPISLVLVMSAIGGVFLTHQARSRPMWRPESTSETVTDRPDSKHQSLNLLSLVGKIILFGALVLAAGLKTAEAAGQITELTGISESLMGSLFLGITTSLPELVTTIASVRAGALTLAISNVVGGNFFDAIFLSIGDAAYRNGSLYHGEGITLREPFLAALCGLLNMVLLIGLLMRQKKGPGRIGVESVMLPLVYLIGMGTLHLLM